MRQNLTIGQWDEITHDEKNKLDDFGALHKYNLCIGELIGYLGEDLLKIERVDSPKEYIVYFEEQLRWHRKELIDSLWEACKFKLLDKILK